MNTDTYFTLKWYRSLIRVSLLGVFVFIAKIIFAQQEGPWLHFQPPADIANGKYVVLISGDEAYRSEESLPMLAKILATHHGFRTTVLFSINPETQLIDPDYLQNIPGLQFLATADLMIIATRFRELPDDQMQYIDQYLNAGKPVIGLRTATHAFHYTQYPDGKFGKYGFVSKVEDWEGGFGKRILGETWVSHHGANGKEGTRGLINGIVTGDEHLILQGVNDVWATTDVYGIKNLPSNSKILVWGQPTQGLTDSSPTVLEKSIMPVAWTSTYISESGKSGKAFATTMGASIDFLNEDLRRLIINASYWAIGLEKQIPEKSKVSIVDEYQPTMFGFGVYQKGKKPLDYK